MDSGNTTPPELWASLEKKTHVFIICFQRYTVFPRYTSVQHALQCFLRESYLPIVKYILAMLNRCVSPRRITEKKNNGWLFTHLQHCECSLRLRANGNFPLGREPRQLQRHLHRCSRNTEGPSIKGISQDPFGTTSETLLNFFLGDPLVYSNMYPNLNIPNDEHGRVVSISTARTPFL